VWPFVIKLSINTELNALNAAAVFEQSGKYKSFPIPMAAWYTAWIYGRWLAGIAGSNLAQDMNVSEL
jgi:hypothetical protein